MKNVEMRKRIGGRIESARKVRRMTQAQLAEELTSPSMRRAWIEIWERQAAAPLAGSPSMRRAWIEIASYSGLYPDEWTLIV